jgi:hypothetical protein
MTVAEEACEDFSKAGRSRRRAGTGRLGLRGDLDARRHERAASWRADSTNLRSFFRLPAVSFSPGGGSPTDLGHLARVVGLQPSGFLAEPRRFLQGAARTVLARVQVR